MTKKDILFCLVALLLVQDAVAKTRYPDTVRIVDITAYWANFQQSVRKGSAVHFLEEAVGAAQNFTSFFHTPIKLGGFVYSSENFNSIVKQYKDGYSPLNKGNEKSDFYSSFYDTPTTAIWCCSGLAKNNSAVTWLNSTVPPFMTFFNGSSPNYKPFFLGFSGMSAFIMILHQMGRVTGIHAPLLDNWYPYGWRTNEINSIIESMKDNAILTYPGVVPENQVAKQGSPIEGDVIGGLLDMIAYNVYEHLITVNSSHVLFIESLKTTGYQEAASTLKTYFAKAGPTNFPRAVLLGQFFGDDPTYQAWAKTQIAWLAQFAQQYNIPVFSGLPIGHGRPNCALRFGPAKLSYFPQNGTLQVKYF